MSENAPQITPRENGPFIVKNVKSFRLSDGTYADEDKAVRALCRCGHSKNKPYCDGSHNDAKFDSSVENPGAKDKVYSYQGAEVTVQYNKLLCSHAAECGRLAPKVFNTKESPWIQPDNGTLEQIAEVINACPSGALRMQTTRAPVVTDSNSEPSVSAQKDGPHWVRNIPLQTDYWATGQSEKKYVLCRCGHSANKPFCDGSHVGAGWREDE